ncbi:aspartyl-tRNA(Asn)/glutamyl-tRNA(Gln) amidotransferase subunit A [Variovorax boronicumulans]|uniref:Aspartyl-tRNA(Asn)/glutamyl-tRNA(Gln) amidotransferase subunit A n=1 Tax=Variovorax boronicumulans TaxID=436515 RepID=A0AAW8D6U1_9BURK|nr:aspartyl-tRNA(Asn)/glutamyl-tRNA(Gln) amidotransferase subunit A [Variovorax boronicumulans]MDQ0038473.1 aspartyl-tRNA(Asn)/glutamyl-tRNA(Gln) amidotransferase subunit A [Variovorax boronicumulans]MDQ0044637.1 aspartyl-tRNA(Asn)/glutamyl-tRNA(Gln) amidotransferase subunit A [Variovorax boronicumulans]MDQ0054700.1 aspartyl-tRNA(Asn)/glutamyl-tRNA(Gln) amidotransferase subunit A [Variovorax boronicumulans]
MSQSISELRKRIHRGETTHEHIVLDVFEKAASPAAKHVFTALYPDAAIAAARAADRLQAAGVPIPLLAGLPVSVKDLFDVAGEPTLAGGIVYRDAAPPVTDAVAVSQLRRHGAAIVGKTNMTEFAFSGVGINPHYGTPVNPADTTINRIPGGSSSGAAVSVALGLAVAGLGSDTGGSIRIPAALCGLVGFKSTQARVSRVGAFELSRTLDTACAMTRSVADCLTVDAALAGSPLNVKRRDLKGVRLAVPRAIMFDGIEAAVASAFDRALETLSRAGAIVTTIAFNELAEIPRLNAPGGFSAVEAFAIHRQKLAGRRQDFDARVAQRLATGSSVSAADYIAMQDARKAWIARAESILEPFDALLCPTVPLLAPEIDRLVSSDEEFFKANGLLLRNPFAINYLDGCAFSIPCHQAGELPVGLMLSSTNGDDASLAAVALAAEAALIDARATA